MEEVVANIEPAEWAEIGGHREVFDGVVEDSTAAGVIECFVVITFAVLVGDVGTALDAGVGWQAPIAGRDTLVVDVGTVGENWGRGILNDVGRQKIACIGRDRVGQSGGGGSEPSGAGGLIPAGEIAPDPVVIIQHEALAGEFAFSGDLDLAALEWDEGDRGIYAVIAAEFKATFALGVFPHAEHAQGELVAGGHVLIEHDFLTRVVVEGHRDGALRAVELRQLADVVDHATGVTLAEEDGGRSLDDLNALDGVEVVGGVAEDAVTHEAVHHETAHREGALRGRRVGRNTHREAGITGRGRRVAEQVGEGLGVGIVKEFARDNRDVQWDLLDLHADLRGGRGVGLEVAVVLVGFNLERAQNLHAFVGLQGCPNGRGDRAGR